MNQSSKERITVAGYMLATALLLIFALAGCLATGGDLKQLADSKTAHANELISAWNKYQSGGDTLDSVVRADVTATAKEADDGQVIADDVGKRGTDWTPYIEIALGLLGVGGPVGGHIYTMRKRNLTREDDLLSVKEDILATVTKELATKQG